LTCAFFKKTTINLSGQHLIGIKLPAAPHANDFEFTVEKTEVFYKKDNIVLMRKSFVL
jgi:hypothetical protein